MGGEANNKSYLRPPSLINPSLSLFPSSILLLFKPLSASFLSVVILQTNLIFLILDLIAVLIVACVELVSWDLLPQKQPPRPPKLINKKRPR